MGGIYSKVLSGTLLLGLLFGLLAGCSTTADKQSSTELATDTPPPSPADPPPDAVPIKTPPSRYGNPRSYVVFGKRYHVLPTSHGFRQRGVASWYGRKFHGRKTSSGIPFNMYAMTAAHKTLPIPTYVKVTHLGNGRSIVVRVNDRGPFSRNRIIDLSYAAAKKLGMVRAGTAKVEVVALPPYQQLAGFTPTSPGHKSLASATPAATAVATGAALVPTPAGPHAAKSVTPKLASDQQHQPTLPLLVLQTNNQSATGPEQVKTDNHPFYLQVGAFTQRHNAEKLQRRLARRLNHPIRIKSATDRLHKVRIGPLTDVSEADLVTVQLADLGVNKPYRIFE